MPFLKAILALTIVKHLKQKKKCGEVKQLSMFTLSNCTIISLPMFLPHGECNPREKKKRKLPEATLFFGHHEKLE